MARVFTPTVPTLAAVIPTTLPPGGIFPPGASIITGLSPEPSIVMTASPFGLNPNTGMMGAMAQQQASPSEKDNKAKQLINNLLLEKVQASRVLHIAFGSISAALALFVIFRILLDSWRAHKLEVRLRPRRYSFLWNLHPVEKFPLILALAIIAQQMLFVGFQVAALDSVVLKNCRAAAVVLFIAMFAVGILHFVFGLETTIRALKRDRFAPAHRFTYPIGLGVTALLMLATFLITLSAPPQNKGCVGNIIWRPASIKMIDPAIALVSFSIGTSIIMASIIGYQLSTTMSVGANERISATRMVYYLAATAVKGIFILPFFVQFKTRTFDMMLSSSKVAEATLFISGGVLAFLHLFLRANAARTAIKPSGTPWHPKQSFRLFGPNDMEYMTISPPINLMNDTYDPDEKVKEVYAKQQYASKRSELPPPPEFYSDKAEEATLESNRTQLSPKTRRWPLPEDGLPSSPRQPRDGSPPRLKPSNYTLFPGAEDVKLPATIYSPPGPKSPPKKSPAPATTLPATTFSSKSSTSNTITTEPNRLNSPSVTDVREECINMRLQPPPAPFGDRKRTRSSSVVSTDSSATVQIGIRLSNAPAMMAAGNLQRAVQTPDVKRMGSNASFSQPFASKQPPHSKPQFLDNPFTPIKAAPQSSSSSSSTNPFGLRRSASSVYSVELDAAADQGAKAKTTTALPPSKISTRRRSITPPGRLESGTGGDAKGQRREEKDPLADFF